MKTGRVLLLSALLALVAGARGPVPTGAYDVVWDAPSKNHHGSMPLGNGDIALNAWADPAGDLQFYIGKSDAWDDNARLAKVGKVRVHLAPNPFAAGRPFRQTLSLHEATLNLVAGVGAQRTQVRVWVDANHPVIHVTVDSAEPLTATVSVELTRPRREEITEVQASDVFRDLKQPGERHAPVFIEPDTVLTGQRDRIGWYHHNIKSVGPRMLNEIQGLDGFPQADPLLHRTFGAVVTAVGGERQDDLHLASPRGRTHRINVYVLTRQPALPGPWLADLDAVIRGVEAQDFSARRAAHEQWWDCFWDRSWIQASSPPPTGPARAPAATSPDDAAYVSQMYHLQRFITAGAGRGAYPIKFNGSLFTVPPGDTEADPDYRRWGPGYWWQNTRLSYYSLCASGDYDLLRPLFRMYADELLPLCRYRTKLYCGHAGAFFPEGVYFWGATFSAAYGWTPFAQRADKLGESKSWPLEWVGGLELCWLMLDYYEHTLDPDFLRQTVLPFTREILTFFEQHYPVNAQGQLVMYPAQALETWRGCTNPMPELAGCIAVTERLLALPAAAASPADRAGWQRLRAKLAPLPRRVVDGRTTLSPAETFAPQKGNVENPELYATFPFRLIALGRPNLDWGRTALALRGDRGHTGWRQDDLFMAYLGATNDLRRQIVARARSHDSQERFPAFWGPNYDWTPDQDHGGVLMQAFQSMLLQTDGPRILLLPAWPQDWDVAFKLHAPGQTVVEGEYRGGRMQSLRVTPEARRKDVELGPFAGGESDGRGPP
ncbi:MAG: DUF5703 domain-containing protein [Opitutales bacterium]|nr:DUF5703 domain-containing protein [Opitutales bacterium]